MEVTKLIIQGLLFIGAIFSIISYMGSVGPTVDNQRNSAILMLISCILLIVFVQRYMW